MELGTGLAPIALAELYRTLRTSCARELEPRLALVDVDFDWLDEVIRGYERMWKWRLRYLDAIDDAFAPAGVSHDRIAAWVVAGLRAFGPSDVISSEAEIATRRALADVEAPQAIKEGNTRPAIVAWGLGQVVGGYDRALPVAFLQPVADISVQLAYEGLVHHVLGLPVGGGTWPEMLGSAVLWRACGLADGLRPQPGRLNVEASVNQLLAEMRDQVPLTVWRRWLSEWPEFKHIRDGLTHLAVGERGRYCFADVATRMQSAADVSLALTSATAFVGHQLALELSEEDPATIHLSDIEYELQAYE